MNYSFRSLFFVLVMTFIPQASEAMETAVLCIPMAVSGVLLVREWLSNKQITAVHRDVKKLSEQANTIQLGVADLAGKVANVHGSVTKIHEKLGEHSQSFDNVLTQVYHNSQGLEDLTVLSQNQLAQLTKLQDDITAYNAKHEKHQASLRISLGMLRKKMGRQGRAVQRRFRKIETQLNETHQLVSETHAAVMELRRFVRSQQHTPQERRQPASAPASPRQVYRDESSSAPWVARLFGVTIKPT